MKKSKSEIVFDIINITVIFFFCVTCLYPFLNMLAIALNEGLDSAKGGIYLLPRKPTIENFMTIFKDSRLFKSFQISALRTFLGVTGALFFNAMAAYALSKPTLPMRKFFNWFITIPMYFSGGIIPYYLVCSALGLTNSFPVYVIPWLIVPYYIILLRSFMQELPESLEESAKIDGASYARIFFQIIIPLSMPSLATVALFAGIMHWNDWFDGTIMVRNKNLWPMQTLLLNIITGSDATSYFKGKNIGAAGSFVKQAQITTESIKAAIIIVTVVPIVMLYPFLQKYLVKGVLVGGVKG